MTILGLRLLSVSDEPHVHLARPVDASARDTGNVGAVAPSQPGCVPSVAIPACGRGVTTPRIKTISVHHPHQTRESGVGAGEVLELDLDDLLAGGAQHAD